MVHEDELRGVGDRGQPRHELRVIGSRAAVERDDHRLVDQLVARPFFLAPSARLARKAFTSSTLPQPSMMAPSAAAPVTRWPSGPLLATKIGMSARTGLKDSLPFSKLTTSP